GGPGSRPASRRDGRVHRRLPGKRCRARAGRARRRARARPQPRGDARARAAFRARHPVAAALPESVDRVRLRPHAGPRRATSARVRPRVRPVRSRGLVRSPRYDCGNGSVARARDPRVVGCARAPARRPRARDGHAAHGLRGGARRTRRGGSGGDVKRFAALYDAIDRTMSTNAKVAALAAYFRDAPPGDAAWATFFLTGRRLKRLIASASLRAWVQEIADIPEWLLGECYAAAGDFAEVVALLIDALPAHAFEPDVPLAEWIHDRILPLAATDEAGQRARVTAWWRGLPRNERFLLNKLLTGEFRVGVAQTLVVRALAQAAQAEPTAIAARLMGDWTPTADWFSSLMAQAHTADPSRPYPFFLASPLEDPPETLGDRSEWLVEWKWDGIRAQLVRRAGEVWLWSRGEELITRRFPAIAAAATHVPDGTVLDGEVLAFGGGRPRPFSALQQRIGRQRQLAQIMRAVPVVFMAYDVMERDATDIRTRPLEERRAGLIAIVAH